MSEVKKKKKRAPPPPGKVKTLESQNGKENLPKQGKKKAPTPKPVIARQLSDKNQAVKLPGPTDQKQLDEARRKLSSTKSIDEQKPEKRFTYSEFLHDDDETDDIFTPTANDTPKIPEEPEPEPEPETEQKVILDEQSKELESETCESEQPEIAAAPEVKPEPEVEIENEFENLNTNGVTIIDDEQTPVPTPEETDFDSFSVQSVSSTHSSRRNTSSSNEVHENIKSEEEVKTPEIFPEKTEFVNAVNLIRSEQNSKMGRTDSQGNLNALDFLMHLTKKKQIISLIFFKGWNRKVIPSSGSADSSVWSEIYKS